MEAMKDSGGNGVTFAGIGGLHGGGIAWYGNLLYVVDTDDGLRVFDLKHIYQVDDSA